MNRWTLIIPILHAKYMQYKWNMPVTKLLQIITCPITRLFYPNFFLGCIYMSQKYKQFTSQTIYRNNFSSFGWNWSLYPITFDTVDSRTIMLSGVGGYSDPSEIRDWGSVYTSILVTLSWELVAPPVYCDSTWTNDGGRVLGLI